MAGTKVIKQKNIAFVDGQNLYLGTKADNWQVDYHKLRVYLKDKYKIATAYYFVGYFKKELEPLYDKLQVAGFIVRFRLHSEKLISNKKGNVDVDIVFEIMKSIVENKSESKIVLISGDGDYKRVVDYVVVKERFLKILLPNKNFASSLYKNMGSEYYDVISNIKSIIELT
jgi:uncharacterized LabA/DUF88 family protein